MKCGKIKRKLDTIYACYMTKGQGSKSKRKYFAYLAISISPEHINVNVHPSKKKVAFMHEDEIIEQIGDFIGKQIRACSSSNTLQMVRATITRRPVDPDRSEALSPRKKVRLAGNMSIEDIENLTGPAATAKQEEVAAILDAYYPPDVTSYLHRCLERPSSVHPGGVRGIQEA